jgi:DNA-binding XRE family transcriptional regulator
VEARGKGASAIEPRRRTRPRDFVEWEALARWGQLAPGEKRVPGYRLRLARMEAGLTQGDVARRLGITQQAVARAERWDSNPTVRFIESWAQALGLEFEHVHRERPRRRGR